MSRKLRWKIVALFVVVLSTSAAAWLPPIADRLGAPLPDALVEKRLRLGLDLRGGVQFVLRVNADEALAPVEPGEAPALTRDDIVAQSRRAVDRRVNALGVVEPVIAVQGARRDEILVELPGFTDVDRARAILGATARLDWRLVEAGPSGTREALTSDGVDPDAADVLPMAAPPGVDPDDVRELFYRVSRESAVNGRDIRRAWVSGDDAGLPVVAFELTPDGGRRFAAFTAAHVNHQIAIVLDDEVQSAPVIDHAITGGRGIIRGRFTAKEATDLALLLQAGSLPVSMTFLGGEYIGPSLGSSAVRAGLMASIGGLLLVTGFMVTYYRRAGVNAVVSLATNLAILLGLMSALGAALTLPGIAGLILTVGMGVDSNVLIFERIKDELRTGRSMRSAVHAGFDRVFRTVLDTHVTSLVAAAFLFQFGSGAIRGFATTLSLGLLTNLFTAVVLSRVLFEWTLARRGRLSFGPTATVASGERRALPVMRHRRLALAFSAGIVALALGLTLIRGLPLGFDFTGGTAVVTQFDQPVDEDDIRQALAGAAVVQRRGAAADRTFQIRVPQPAGFGEGDDAEGVSRIEAGLRGSTVPAFRTVRSTTVGPTVGHDLRRQGAFALAGALAGITVYLGLRFRPSFATGAAVALAHDLVMTTAMLSLAGYELDLTVVAGLLTVAGYSVNDTIVIFDRIRERLRVKGAALPAAVDAAVGDTLGRTIITSGTTLAAVAALYVLGGDALGGFSFTVLCGIVAGTWSSVVVAVPVAVAAARR